MISGFAPARLRTADCGEGAAESGDTQGKAAGIVGRAVQWPRVCWRRGPGCTSEILFARPVGASCTWAGLQEAAG